MQPSLPQDIALGLPFIAAALTHYLTSDNLAAWKNALIAAVFIVATALVCVWFSGSFIPGNAQASVLAVLAYVALLMRGPLSLLMLFFADVPSPFDKPPAPANANPIRIPTALTMPPGSSPVPPRASAEKPTTPGA